MVPLQDDTGHSWDRVDDWVEPSDAERLVQQGVRFVVQQCRTAPVAGRRERFKRDVGTHMVIRSTADGYVGANSVPTVMVGELWHSKFDGDLLLFVERGPFSRSAEELQDDW